jgi:hypothetical protein
MAESYSITIDLNDPNTLQFLKGKSLRVYKSVRTGATGLPVVWFSQSVFGHTVSLGWTEQYAGYVSDLGNPVAGMTIKDVSSEPMDLGQVLTAQDDGDVDVSNKGVKGAITVKNLGSRDWMCGMGQEVNGELAPICAFDLGGQGEQVIMEPYEKVLLVFESSAQMNTGTVIAEAISASLTVELDGQNTSRTVVFRKSTGWTTNTAGWATQNDSDLTLADALIVPNA